MGRLRVLLVDDHVLLRSALRGVLEGQADMEVVGEAGSGDEAMKQAERLLPEVILLDMAMPGMSGPEAARHLKQALPSSRILALSAYEDEAAAHRMLSAGADGFIPKSAQPEALLHAIRRVASGRDSLDGAEGHEAPPSRARSALTADEAEVLKRFARGFPLKQIASSLGLAVVVVERHKAQGMDKLGLKTRAQVARFADEQGWK